ncbi:hypothetical protein JCM39068_00680 [Desulfocastanea catecholica]
MLRAAAGNDKHAALQFSCCRQGTGEKTKDMGCLLLDQPPDGIAFAEVRGR